MSKKRDSIRAETADWRKFLQGVLSRANEPEFIDGCSIGARGVLFNQHPPKRRDDE